MRGWLTLLTKEKQLKKYRTGLFVATAEPELIGKVLTQVLEDFPAVSFTFAAPRDYSQLFEGRGETVWLEDIKTKPFRSIAHLRSKAFDLAVAVFAGRPTFRKPKLATFLVNPKRFIFYNEHADRIVLDRTHGRVAAAHFIEHSRYLNPGQILFIPFGFLYLAVRILCLRAQGRLQPFPHTDHT
jgi:hypothetical protein